MIREEVDRLNIVECLTLGQKINAVDYPSSKMIHRLDYIRERLAARLRIENDDVKKLLNVDIESRKAIARNIGFIAKGVDAIKDSLGFMSSVLSKVKGIADGIMSLIMKPPTRSPVHI